MKFKNIKILLVSLVLLSPAFGSHAKTKAHKKGQKLTINRPADFGIVDKFYLTYISPVDQGILNAYEKGWRFHEKQVQYNPAFQKDERYTMGTQESYGYGQKDSVLRNEFAEQVLRMRIDSAVKTYFADKKGSFGKKAIDTVENLKDVRVKTASAADGKQPEIAFGYDVLTDSSRIEYIKGNIEAGIYHPKLTGAFMGRARLTDANLSVWTNMDGTVPRTAVSLPVTANTFTTSVSKPLATNVMGTVGTSQPLKDVNANQSYDVSVAFTF